MIEIGVIVGFNDRGAPVARLSDTNEVEVVPPRETVLTTGSANGPDPHTHTVQVGGVQQDDRVAVVEGAGGEWFVVCVY